MILFDKEKCILCGECARDCIQQAIWQEGKEMRAMQPCLLCGHCVAVCPAGAVSIDNYEDKPEEYCRESFSVEPDNMLHAIKFRRSIRRFKDQVIERKKLELLIDAGMHTATASNRQEVSYIMVQENRDELKRLVFEELGQVVFGEMPEVMKGQEFFWRKLKTFYEDRNTLEEKEMLFRNAPAVIYILGDRALDAGLAAQNMELMACSLGLGFMYNGYLARISMMLPQVRQFLGTGDREILACILAGYPDVTYHRTAPRKTPEVTWL
ncbi:MAG: nitroreductase family protein [Eubacteriales bacterium]|nr:nitroreductase family protein [Eubacteriales bacterium]